MKKDPTHTSILDRIPHIQLGVKATLAVLILAVGLIVFLEVTITHAVDHYGQTMSDRIDKVEGKCADAEKQSQLDAATIVALTHMVRTRDALISYAHKHIAEVLDVHAQDEVDMKKAEQTINRLRSDLFEARTKLDQAHTGIKRQQCVIANLRGGHIACDHGDY